MKLLQVPTAVLEERIKEELEENPALEYSEDGQEDDFKDNSEEFETGETEDDFEPDGSENEYDNIDISEYVSEGDDEISGLQTTATTTILNRTSRGPSPCAWKPLFTTTCSASWVCKHSTIASAASPNRSSAA